jgi:hypothetical protein
MSMIIALICGLVLGFFGSTLLHFWNDGGGYPKQ